MQGSVLVMGSSNLQHIKPISGTSSLVHKSPRGAETPLLLHTISAAGDHDETDRGSK
jgi:hypothetical protein